MRRLPETLKKYKQTPEFNEISVPKGLLQDHSTKNGVWGKIVLLEGEMEYFISGDEKSPHSLNPSKYGVVEPERTHYIKPKGKVRFYVEFYREE